MVLFSSVCFPDAGLGDGDGLQYEYTKNSSIVVVLRAYFTKRSSTLSDTLGSTR